MKIVMKVIQGLKHLSYEEKLRYLRLFILEKVEGLCKKYRARLFSVASSDKTRGSVHKLTYRRFPLNIRKYFLSVGDQAY